jgi:ATPase subunit of ABC transporter with duplicated ATPase domains
MDLETVGNVTSSMRKDLAAAHILAAEQHDLDFYKEILKNFMEARAAELEAKEAAKAAKKAEKAEKAEKASKPKRKSKAPVDEDAEGDVEMADAPGEEVDDEDIEEATSEKKNKKKRKASDDGEVSFKPRSKALVDHV